MKKKQTRKVVRRRGEAVIKITRKPSRDAEETSSERRIVVDDLPEHPAYVRVDGGLTKNLGDYESARLSVSISIPCHIDNDSIKDSYERVSKLVESCLDEEFEKVVGD
jgi:hypothetical protein